MNGSERADGSADRPLSVLFVSARYPPYIGGTEIHTAEVASRLAARGHDVSVLATTLDPDLAGDEVIDRVRVMHRRAWPRRLDLYFCPDVYRVVRAGSWDVVHCQGYHTLVAPAAMLAAVRSKQRFVVTFHSGGHSSRARRAIRPVQRVMLRPLLARAHRLIGVSRFETEYFQRSLRFSDERFATVPNGVSPEFLEPTPDNERPHPTICSVGRLEKYKGHHRVIAALPAVREFLPDVVLEIVGDGPYRSSLGAMAKRLGVADAVRFSTIAPGDRRAMAAKVRASHLVTLLSAYESQGLVGLESIAVGRPLLVSSGTALPELSQFGDVRVVPPHVNGDDLGMMIAETIMKDLTPDRKMVPMWEHTVDELLAIYRSVLDSPSERTRR